MKLLLSDSDDFDLCVTPEIPLRSRLFSLVAYGIGTPDQEGLLSLIVRTCHAHAVNPRRMIAVIFPTVEPLVAKIASSPFFGKLAGTVSGLGQYAKLFVSATEQLTGQRNLAALTMLPWQGLFPHNGQGLLARQRRWCPVCLVQRTQDGEPVPVPLAWSLEAYSCCSKHGCSLEERCPYCGKPQPYLPRYPDLGICEYCRSALGECTPDREISPIDQWVAEAIGDMVARNGEAGFSPDAAKFLNFLSAQIHGLADGNQAAFCRAIGLAEHAMKGWFKKGERPSMTQFLSICYGTQTMSGAMFTTTLPEYTKPPGLRKLPHKLKTRKPQPRPMAAQRADIEKMLDSKLGESSADSVSMIAAELGVGVGCLRYWFPNQCADLSRRHRVASKARSVERQGAQCRRLEEIVREIVRGGYYPSRRRVNSHLRKESMSLVQPHLGEAMRQVLKKLQQEMGYELQSRMKQK